MTKVGVASKLNKTITELLEYWEEYTVQQKVINTLARGGKYTTPDGKTWEYKPVNFEGYIEWLAQRLAETSSQVGPVKDAQGQAQKGNSDG